MRSAPFFVTTTKKEDKKMDYAVIRCVNGAFAIHAEFSGDKRADDTPWTDAEKKNAARASFAAYWGALENDKEFKGRVDLKVIDSQLDCVDGLKVLVVKE